jgi:hypothetical protein
LTNLYGKNSQSFQETKATIKKHKQGAQTHDISGHFPLFIVGFCAYSLRVFWVIVGITTK